MICHLRQVSCFDRIWESGRLTTNTERKLILQHIDSLRCSRQSPNQNFLVDPYRHGYRYGRSCLRHPDELESFADLLDAPSTSSKYAMLPSHVEVHLGHPRAIYLSYINGVDPAMSDLYSSLQKTLGCSIKLFEKVLTSLHRSNPLPQRIKGTYRYKVWDEPDPPEDSDEEAWEAHQRDVRQWALYRPIEIPDIPKGGYRKGNLRFAHEVRFKEKQTIQVVHRIIDIRLVRNLR